MTVSNACSRPDQLPADLRDRSMAAAEELGYVGPDPAARALARCTTGAVGLVLTSVIGSAFGDEVATQFLGSIVEGLAPSGLSLGIEPVIIEQPHSTEDDGYAALGQLLNAGPGITAVLCFADTIAHGVMLAAQDRGLDIPVEKSRRFPG